MGNTTIIEFNHDLVREVEDNPARFVEVVLQQLRTNEYEDRRIPGGRVIVFFHRGDSPTHKVWEAFKRSIGR